ncbi:hypothetical protein [Pantoea alhagi]|nr:hypothetical protein [Pantoea alhagi]
MLKLIIIAVLIALMGYALTRHWKVRNEKTVNNPYRHSRRR